MVKSTQLVNLINYVPIQVYAYIHMYIYIHFLGPPTLASGSYKLRYTIQSVIKYQAYAFIKFGTWGYLTSSHIFIATLNFLITSRVCQLLVL